MIFTNVFKKIKKKFYMVKRDAQKCEHSYCISFFRIAVLMSLVEVKAH